MSNPKLNKQSLGAALWQWGRHRELPESADAIFEAAEVVYDAMMGGDLTELLAIVGKPEASVGERLAWEKCGTCEGRGFWTEWQQTTEADGKQTYHDCPDCFEGWVPPAELVERAAVRLHRDNPNPEAVPWSEAAEYPYKERVRGQAKGVLSEQARWIGEQE